MGGGGPLLLLQPLCNDAKHINQYKRVCSTKAWPDPASGSLGWRQKGADCRPGGNWEYCPAGTLNLFASKSAKEEQVSFQTLISRKQHAGFIKFPCP